MSDSLRQHGLIFCACLPFLDVVPLPCGLVLRFQSAIFEVRNTLFVKVGYTTGVFDLFHVGHLAILQRARLECDYLIVGVTTDELCKAAKGRFPVIPFSERVEIVGSIRCVDRVVPQSSYDKLEAWRILAFNIVFVGDDWRNTVRWNQLERDFKKLNVAIRYLPYTQQTSSSKIRERLENESLSDAGYT